MALVEYQYQRGDVTTYIPEGVASAEDLNAFVVQELVRGRYLVVKVLRDRGWLIEGSVGKPVLVDAWKRPLVFIVPTMHAAGLKLKGGDNGVLVRPLPLSVWPTSAGAIQVWSLGDKGIVNTGGQGYILPTNVRALTLERNS
jgi:hypothetical protein